ncbi:MAG: hypothetical protein J6X55_01485 [Victivallales bacterium]|nr:hypothetical protein [Victivallales bacterium]
MSILFISDIHLYDSRNSVAFEAQRLQQLSEFIKGGNFELVVNLGDTVSRDGCLREELRPYRKNLFAGYLHWRETVGVPFLECGIYRERPFFEEIYGQSMDFAYKALPGVTAISFCPISPNDHVASEEQWRWFSRTLDEAEGAPVVVCTHVPYPGCCSRPVENGIYMEVPDSIQRRLESFSSPVYWAGGHFHWALEPPVVTGSLTSFMGGKFYFEKSSKQETYFRTFDPKTLKLETIVNLI